MMGAPEASEMPMHRGRATRKTTREAGASLASTPRSEPAAPTPCSFDFIT